MKKVLELLPTAEPKSDLNKPKKQKKTKSQIVNRETSYNNSVVNLNAKCKTNPHLIYTPFRQYRGTEEYIKQVADGLIWWVDNDPNALDMSQFCKAHSIPKVTLWAWAQKSEYLKWAMSLAKDSLAWKREIALAEGTLHPSTVIATRHVYDEVYSSEEDRRAVLVAKAKAEATKPADVTIYMQDLVAQDEEIQ